MTYDARHDALSIAVTGMGGVFPGAPDLEAFWKLIDSGKHRSAVIPGNRWPVPPETLVKPGEAVRDRVRSARACLIESLDFDPGAFGLDPDLLVRLDPLFHLMLMAGHAAYNDQRGCPARRETTGVILGNIILPTETVSAMTRELAEPALRELIMDTAGIESDLPSIHPLNRYPSALPAGLLARSLELGGGSYTLDAACASSLYAVKLAVNALIQRRLDAVITGGVGRPDSMYTQMGFSQLRALSPSGICAPFDRSADGLVVGEGAAMVVLKRLDDAVRDGDRIYCVIRGIGLSNDVGGSLFAPDSEGQLRAMRKAYDQAGWRPGDIDLVECHATGTPVGDAVEFDSMRSLWSETGARPPGRCVIGSVKSNIGHLLTGAGGAGLIKTILAMNRGILPPTANFNTPAPRMDLDSSPFRVLRAPEPWKRRGDSIPRRAAVSAFGFGGINAHVLIEEFLPSETDVPEHITRPETAPVAVVGLAMTAGEWVVPEKIQQRIMGYRDPVQDRETGAADAPWQWLTRSEWFRRHAVNPGDRIRHHLGPVMIPPGRFRIPPAELREMLPQQLIMLKTAADAVDNSAWRDDLAPETGVFIGLDLDLDTTRFQVRWHLERIAAEWAGGDAVSPEWVESVMDAWSSPLTANRTMGALGGIVASRIARALKAGGAGFTVSSHENSGIRALETAVTLLQSGDIRQALVGAVDLATDWRALVGETALWSKAHAGTLAPAADGAVALVLKPLADAEADGDTILAVIREIAAGSGTDTGWLPAAETLETVCRRVAGDAVPDLHVLSGRGPEAENSVETAVYETLWEPLPAVRHPVPVNVTRSIGHTGAAAGLFNVAAAVAGLHHRVVPGTPDPDPVYRAAGLISAPAPEYWIRNREEGSRTVLVSGLSIDGNASAVLLSEHEPSTGHALRLPDLDAPFEERFSAALELSMRAG
ncbi:MAG TPA: beta-ketoacyl synthase N-terminal-like domain-containing protein, partial [bacterium]|nr:beta-ketoacyl synthase N-terminal-like domain-containing protein [bacterium]